MPPPGAVGTRPWTERGRRAQELLAKEDHAAELLTLYAALAEASAEIAEMAAGDRPSREELPGYVASAAMPRVLDRTLAAGPGPLREAAVRRFHAGDPGAMVRAWLAGAEQPPADRYLARAASAPVIEALPGLVRLGDGPASGGRRCPACGGLPQLACFEVSEEALVTGPRNLVCARCAHSWAYPRMVCAGCGNEDTSTLPIYADPERFPSLRIDACEACRTYLVTVDRARDRAAVAIVDELVAIPLDLHAAELGFRKITPNLMGF